MGQKMWLLNQTYMIDLCSPMGILQMSLKDLQFFVFVFIAYDAFVLKFFTDENSQLRLFDPF